MTNYLCPICHEPLFENQKTLCCEKGHSYDRAAVGYVNLTVGSSASHGDDKTMVSARKRFLELGCYAPMRDSLCRFAAKYTPENGHLLDAGCGEGYYTSAVADSLESGDVAAIDISKHAIASACKRRVEKSIDYAVASVYAIPCPDAHFDTVISVFSPFAREEFLRVLKENGTLISVIPQRRHLYSLKCAIYDEPYENEVQPYEVEGFELVESDDISYDFALTSNQAIADLFSMTPYYYRTPKSGHERLCALNELTCEARFTVLVYKKK
ncbi:MAG: methyltransferase domain-containing protein [Clostridia bacterium]|nr:methyltransferase domain-containing protein [Clostridia bacterium]